MAAKKNVTKGKKGRRSYFKQEYCELAYNYSLLGATDAEMAVFFGVSEQTLNTWKKRHPHFLESIKKGKEIADAQVASKLFHRATGYEHEDVDIKVVDKKIIKTKLIKHYPPDTTAGIFWLKNRQKEKWREKQEVDVKHSGTVEGMSSEELLKIVKEGK